MGEVFALFGILAGFGWLAKEAGLEKIERLSDKRDTQETRSFIRIYSDKNLESKYKEFIDKPECYDKIWRKFETFKRDNPIWCNILEKKGGTCGYLLSSGRSIETFPNKGWGCVGKIRKPFRTKYGHLYTRDKYENDELISNRFLALRMLLNIEGKDVEDLVGNYALFEKYPIKRTLNHF